MAKQPTNFWHLRWNGFWRVGKARVEHVGGRCEIVWDDNWENKIFFENKSIHGLRPLPIN
jgi:hypothetical protein